MYGLMHLMFKIVASISMNRVVCTSKCFTLGLRYAVFYVETSDHRMKANPDISSIKSKLPFFLIFRGFWFLEEGKLESTPPEEIQYGGMEYTTLLTSWKF